MEAANDKRKQFGTRYLTDDSAVFTYNAWDNVEWNDTQLREAKAKVDKQKETAVEGQKAEQLKQNASIQWDEFYSKHDNKFFMDRNWLLTEFPELNMDGRVENNAGPLRVLEVGCGVGNTTFPLLDSCAHGQIFVYSCDYSANAIELMKKNEKFDAQTCHAFEWDICGEPTDQIAANSLDFILLIYVLSAIPPEKQQKAVDNLVRLLKPGGLVLLKDYGEYDLTQLRFKKNRFIDEKLYCRGDGTLVYFFTQNELDRLFRNAGLSKENKKQLLRLCCETIRCKNFLDGLLECQQIRDLLTNKSLGDFSLLYVLLYEFVLGKGIRNISKRLSAPILAISKLIHEQAEHLKEAGRGVMDDEKCDNDDGTSMRRMIPRYARVNTLKWSFDEALKALEQEDWIIERIESTQDMEVFRECVKNMAENQIIIDPHIENLLLFRGDLDLHSYWIVDEGYVLLQDKASCLPAVLLKPKENSEVFDCCAAPGMKTSHLAAILCNSGKIWAMDKSSERIRTLRMMLKNAAATNVNVLCDDFLSIDVTDQKFAKVHYALVDPPCSGSGIVKRMDKYFDDSDCTDERRLRSLSNLQAMILKQAFKFPKLKRLVYSTCSIHTQENEAVVEEVLNDETISEKWELENALPNWSHRGDSKHYEFADKCIRASPTSDLTNGFFVAVFRKKKKHHNAPS
ncbi:unnamed protein product [Anisakis simplex]|uniref:Putative methyltransferase NSUN5 (inferred by orthology to a human protein) n=1 Tax=Anisakis simplex TaxID=6269 RepID=A0A0M3JU90_ANISI|nr:unnamed protein product [Anisakis simplex]